MPRIDFGTSGVSAASVSQVVCSVGPARTSAADDSAVSVAGGMPRSERSLSTPPWRSARPVPMIEYVPSRIGCSPPSSVLTSASASALSFASASETNCSAPASIAIVPSTISSVAMALDANAIPAQPAQSAVTPRRRSTRRRLVRASSARAVTASIVPAPPFLGSNAASCGAPYPSGARLPIRARPATGRSRGQCSRSAPNPPEKVRRQRGARSPNGGRVAAPRLACTTARRRRARGSARNAAAYARRRWRSRSTTWPIASSS